MKKILILLFVLLSINTSFAQTKTGTNLKWSSAIRGINPRLYGVTEDYFVICDEYADMSGNRTDVYVVSIDNLKLIKHIYNLRPKIEGKAYFSEGGVVFQDKLIIEVESDKEYIQIYSLPDLKLEQTIMINNNEPKITVSENKYATTSDNWMIERARIKNRINLKDLVISENKEFLFILKKDLRIYRYSVIDSELEHESGSFNFKNIDDPKTKRLGYLVTNNGKPYLLYKDGKALKKPLFIADFKNQKTYNIDFEAIFINHKMIEHNSLIEIHGICYFKSLFQFYKITFNPKTNEFSEIILTSISIPKTLEYTDAKTVKKLNKKIDKLPLLKFSLDGIKYLDDGSYYIYGEYYSIIAYYGDKNYEFQTTNEIYVANISKSGNLNGLKIVPKIQEGKSRVDYYPAAYVSYIPYLSDNKMHFLFADSPKNNDTDLHEGVKRTKGKSPQTTICTVDVQGNVTRNIWINNDTKKVFPTPQLSIDLGGKYIIGTHIGRHNNKFAIYHY